MTARKRDTERDFRKIKHERDKQIRARNQAQEEVVYVDSSRNISVNYGEDDLKQDMETQGLCTVTEDRRGPSSLMLHNEAIHHLRNRNMLEAKICVEKAQDLLEDTDFNILTTQAELELQKGNYNAALKTSGTILTNVKTKLESIFVKAECLFNLYFFEHLLALYHKGKLGRG